MTVWLSAILAVIKLVGMFVDRLDDAEKKKAHAALMSAARMKVEDDVAETARAAYRASMSKPDGVQYPDKYFRD